MARTCSLLFAVWPLAAQAISTQIEGPRLGFVARDGELRRIEGLSVGPRLSDPSPLGPSCGRVSASPGGRWALCAVERSTVLVDLWTLRVQLVAEAPFEAVFWSPNGRAAVVDGVLVTGFGGTLNKSDAGGAVAVADDGSLYRGEGPAVYDGREIVTASGSRVMRGGQSYSLRFAPGFLVAGSDRAIYAAAGTALARIDILTGAVAEYELPAEATRLELLLDGTVLFASPGPGEPGWLFRYREGEGGRAIFIPGLPQ